MDNNQKYDVICPKCGVKNKGSRRYCFFCGEFLDPNVVQVVEEGSNVTGKVYTFPIFIILLCFSFAVLATLGLYAFFISLALSVAYLIFGNSKVFKKILIFVCSGLGLVMALVVIFVVAIFIWFFLSLSKLAALVLLF